MSSNGSDAEGSAMTGIIILAVIAALAIGFFYLVRHFSSAPKPPPVAVVKCPHCGKDVPIRVVRPEEEK